MGNRKLRKKVSELLKSSGLGKLYYGNKKIAYSLFSATELKRMLRRLELTPGTIVNDCDGFNHKIKSLRSQKILWYKNTVVTRLDQFVFTDGSLSCGCPYGPDDAWTTEEITSFHSLSQEEIEESKQNGFWNERQEQMQNLINSRIPICDENGFKQTALLS